MLSDASGLSENIMRRRGVERGALRGGIETG
jgi:hypothetical protein